MTQITHFMFLGLHLVLLQWCLRYCQLFDRYPLLLLCDQIKLQQPSESATNGRLVAVIILSWIYSKAIGIGL